MGLDIGRRWRRFEIAAGLCCRQGVCTDVLCGFSLAWLSSLCLEKMHGFRVGILMRECHGAEEGMTLDSRLIRIENEESREVVCRK